MSVRSYYYIFFMAIFFIAAYFVGSRDLTIGTDTFNYMSIYKGSSGIFEGRIEVGFLYLARFLSFLNLEYHVFFAVCFLIVSFFMYHTYNKINYSFSDSGFFISSLVFFVFLFSSDWFFVATANGLRQGIALAILYYAISFLIDKNFKRFFLFYFFSGLFHKSVYLTFPFLIPIFFHQVKIKYYSLAIVFFGVGYFFSINEVVVKYFSILAGINLYLDIKYYADDGWGNATWFGFDSAFFIYTCFWYFLVLFMVNLNLFYESKKSNIIFVLKVYCVLSIYYFVFGYGGFSNRWAFAAWLFLPILQSTVLVGLKVSIKLKLLFGVFLFLPYFYYISKFLPEFFY